MSQKDIVLERYALLDNATLGRMRFPSGLELYTLERPWLNNKPFVSCIPDGLYPLEWDTTGRIRNVPRLRNTSPRTQINIHAANWAHQLHGCIAVGMAVKLDSPQGPMITQSQEAMKLLLAEINVRVQQDGSPMLYRKGETQFAMSSAGDQAERIVVLNIYTKTAALDPLET